ncbi:POK10 protein, partial [Balaeniceps rex]|nr:POK10 protein [Balaeniceps rex]
HIKPQVLQITKQIKTLNDLQKLLGTVNWVRSMLGISNNELSHLFASLKGNSDLTSE